MCLLGVPGPGLAFGMDILRAWGFTFSTIIVPGTKDSKLQTEANLGLSAAAHVVLAGVRGCRPDLSGRDPIWQAGLGSLEFELQKLAREWLPDVKIDTVPRTR